MVEATGQDPGHGPGMTWGDLLAAIVDGEGTLTAVAWKLIEHAPGDDVASVERALRRLRQRGHADGGVWGQRLLRVFGVPAEAYARVRWMGLYHSPFGDLPRTLCLDQLRLWDRPPVSTSRARVWLHLGQTSCALRQRALEDAGRELGRAASALAGAQDQDDARVEHALASAFLASQRGEAAAPELDRAASILEGARLTSADDACFRARLVDQRAYQANRAGDHEGAMALYDSLPTTDVHPFASYRRDAGLAFGHLRAGRREDARRLALAACEQAGDGGYTRLRAMGLLILARASEPAEAAAAIARAAAIAERLEDAELMARIDRRRRASG
ncbi:MAG: hypothetical protein R3B09_13560 [Nannocystaceae bacterium]